MITHIFLVSIGDYNLIQVPTYFFLPFYVYDFSLNPEFNQIQQLTLNYSDLHTYTLKFRNLETKFHYGKIISNQK